MHWVMAFHVIFVVAWFAGIFYLPRLFVYHAQASDRISIERFKIMEHKLLHIITLPSATCATLLGLWLLSFDTSYYMRSGWMHAKLTLVILLWVYNIFCLRYTRAFKNDNNQHSHTFYRYFNEIPVIMLIFIVILVIVKPHF
jgi:protoporphyrinogen IX oxidase